MLFESMIIELLTLNNSSPNHCGFHSLRYTYSAYASNDKLVEFVAQGLLDDVQIDYYDNHIRRKVPKQQWMNESMEAGYWERGTQSRNSKEHWFTVNTRIVMQRRNDTSGYHTLQWVHGCSLTDGIKIGIDQYAYDGEDFLSFDKESLSWIAVNKAAQQTREKWDEEKNLNQYTKRYLEQECIEWLQNFLRFSNGKLEKKVGPETKIFRKRRHDGKYTFSCHASEFFPSALSIKWINIKTNEKKEYTAEALPNSDGTFQAWVDIDSDLECARDLVCMITHGNSSEEHRIPAELCEAEKSFLYVIIIAVVVVVLLLLFVAVLLFLFLKKKKKKKMSAYAVKVIVENYSEEAGLTAIAKDAVKDETADLLIKDEKTATAALDKVSDKDETSDPLIEGNSENHSGSSSSERSNSSGYSSENVSASKTEVK
ncbi:major histocompatibility complex class I-related gene protein-like [Protopterus annectens]|uniref:major histocompatibility complex class I-related gene protein-like n=1 Tax=Protopterus annectens TaxID=7888 RepID=UPI001CFB62CA|nr:major histocompatibility complex class I-related gene protein-like [Protopterus annectens]